MLFLPFQALFPFSQRLTTSGVSEPWSSALRGCSTLTSTRLLRLPFFEPPTKQYWSHWFSVFQTTHFSSSPLGHVRKSRLFDWLFSEHKTSSDFSLQSQDSNRPPTTSTHPAGHYINTGFFHPQHACPTVFPCLNNGRVQRQAPVSAGSSSYKDQRATPQPLQVCEPCCRDHTHGHT